MPESGYEPNDVIIWTDTFKSRTKGEEHIFKTELKANDERRASEDKLDIRVIIGNPPIQSGRIHRMTTTRTNVMTSWTRG